MWHHTVSVSTRQSQSIRVQGPVSNPQNYILQLTDSLTSRKCALRIDPDDSNLSLAGLLDKNLKHCLIQRFLSQGRLTEDSAETLQVLQDLVYVCSDSGQLRDMYAGVVFKQRGRLIESSSVPEAELARVGGTQVAVIDVAIDRVNVGYDRNWAGFHRRRWNRRSHLFSDFVRQSLRRDHSEHEVDAILTQETREHKLRLLKSLARRVWESEFENYSRFVGEKLPYKTGDETVHNIINGGGGICSEKVQALRFLTDQYGIPSQYLLAGAGARSPVPEDKLRELLTTFDFRFAKRHMRYWQHTALLYDVDGATILVDATNGNIPFLFLEDEDSQRLLGHDDKRPVTARMGLYEEDFYYHRVSQDIAENLFFAMETWVPEIDLIQVFDNELGLYISSDFFVTPVVFRSQKEYERLRRQYVRFCNEAELEYAIDTAWTLDSPLCRRFTEQNPDTSEKIILAKDHLLDRYDAFEGSGHRAGLAVIGLRRNQ